MLSRHDRAVLHGMETALSVEVPELVASFDQWREPRPAAHGLTLAICLAVLLMLAGLLLASVVVFWLGALSAGGLLGVGYWRRRTATRRRPTG